MKATEAKAIAQMVTRRSSKIAVVMYCTAEIAAQALKGVTQMTIETSGIIHNSIVSIQSVMDELKNLGYIVHKVSDTRIYVSWDAALELAA